MSGARRCTVAGLCLWGAGVQMGEAPAAAGVALSAMGLFWTWASGSRRWPAELRAFWPVWLFIGWALVAPALAGGWPTSGGLFRILDWGFAALGALAFAELDPRGRRAVAIACGAALVVSCAVAGMQFFGAWPSRETMRPLAPLFPGFERVYEPASATSTSHFMAGGLLFHRLKFSGVSGVFVLWAVALSVWLRGRDRAIAAGVAAFGLVSVLVFPVARAGALALVGAAAATAALASGRRRVALGAALAFLALGGVAVALNPEMRARLAAATSVSGDEDRVHLRRAGLSALALHPVAGMGVGRYHARDYMGVDAPESVKAHPGKAHLQLLTIAIETGVPGVLLCLFMLGWMAARLWPNGAAGLGVLVFLLVMGLLHDPLFHAETSMAFAFALAAALGTVPSRGEGGEQARG